MLSARVMQHHCLARARQHHCIERACTNRGRGALLNAPLRGEPTRGAADGKSWSMRARRPRLVFPRQFFFLLALFWHAWLERRGGRALGEVSLERVEHGGWGPLARGRRVRALCRAHMGLTGLRVDHGGDLHNRRPCRDPLGLTPPDAPSSTSAGNRPQKGRVLGGRLERRPLGGDCPRHFAAPVLRRLAWTVVAHPVSTIV